MLLSHNSADFWNVSAILGLTANLGPGFQFAVGGFVLVAIFAELLFLGRVTLPVHLIVSPTPCADDLSENSHHRTMMFVWIMTSLLPLALLLEGAVVLVVFSIPGGPATPNASQAFWGDQIGSALSLLILILLALGKKGRASVRGKLRFPEPPYLGLAALFPAAIACVWPACFYLHDRIHWAAYGWGRSDTPHLGSYFHLPRAAFLWYLVPALIEEIAWRGYLQPRFIRRYGVMRGIFLLGIVWGAFHFGTDFNSYMMPGTVALQIIRRLAGTVAYSYVLAWLTIRSQSILPAAVAHGVLNIFVYDPLPISTPFWVLVALWTALGYVLFHYFPPQLNDEVAASESDQTWQPAL
jgi:membrane protease YdiL (CAAX protease family)